MKIYPKTFSIETFLGCNARCIMCSVNEWSRDHGVMEMKLYDNIIEQVRSFKNEVYQFALFLDGEPLLDNYLHTRIEKAKIANIPNVGFTTNAFLFNKDDKIKKILNSNPDWIVVSFDSLIKENYEKIRLRLKFDRVFSNILNLINERNKYKKKTSICLRYIEQDINKNEFKEYFNFFSKKLNNDLDEIHFAKSHNWGGANEFGIKNGNSKCEFIYNRFVIMKDGTVPLCCIDFNAKEKMGNIKNDSILNIFNSQKWNNYRELHSKNLRCKIEICKNCDIPELELNQNLSNKFKPSGTVIAKTGSIAFKKN
jgi:radical SAM protein with 4Fe4S-binding SPASM domain